MVDTFLPAIRQLVAKELRSRGFSQSAISSLLGITQASVSLYLSSSPERAYSSLSLLSVGRQEAARYAVLLSEDVERSPLDAQVTLDSVWKGLLGGGMACDAHRARYPMLADCDICLKEFGSAGNARSQAIAEVSEAVRSLESSPSFASAMPEVSVNIAYAPSDAQTPEGVIAIPGRIVRVGGAVKSFSRPEYGASSHLAKVLITVRKIRSDVHAVMNIRFDAKMAKVLKKLGLRSIKTGARYPRGAEDPVVEGIQMKLANARQEFDTIIDTGGPGFEPSLYLLGSDPVRVAELAIKISRAYSAI